MKRRFTRGTSQLYTPMTSMVVDAGPTSGSAGSGTGSNVPFFQRRRSTKKFRGRSLSGKQVLQVKRIVARRQELKYFAVLSNFAAITAATYMIDLTQIPQGDTDSTRDGDHLMLCGTPEFHVRFQNDLTGAGDAGAMYRLIIFQWHPSNGTAPIGSDILLTGVSGAVDYTSFYSHDKRQLYTILYDECFKTWGHGAGGAGPGTNQTDSGLHRIKYSFAKAQKQCQYQGGSTSGTNQIYMFMIHSSANLVGNQNAWLFASKIFYRDG